MATITKEEREKDRAISEAATPGPWEFTTLPHDERKGTNDVCDMVNDCFVMCFGDLRRYEDDGRFIALARGRLPLYIAALDALDERMATIEALKKSEEEAAQALRRVGEHVRSLGATHRASGLAEALRILRGEK